VRRLQAEVAVTGVLEFRLHADRLACRERAVNA
jgi:hypothetical protein